MNNRYKVKQFDEYDCGAASLASVAKWFGIDAPLAQIRRECGCSPEGITIQGIIDGSESLGLSAKALKVEEANNSNEGEIKVIKIECLKELKFINAPIIAHLKKKDGFMHFVVVYKVTESSVLFMDPAEGEYIKEDIDSFANIWSGYIITFKRTSVSKIDNKEGKWARIFYLFGIYKKDIVYALIGSIGLTIIGVCNSLFLQNIIDYIIPSRDMKMLLIISSLILILIPTTYIISYYRNIYLIRCGFKIDSSLVINFLERIFKLPTSFFDEYKSGDLESRMSDSSKIRILITEGFVNIFICTLSLIIVIALMFTIYWKLAVSVLLFCPIYLLLYYFSNRINKRYKKEIAEIGGKFEGNVIDCLEGAHTLKHYYNGKESIYYSKNLSLLIEKGYKGSRIMSIYQEIGNNISQLLLASIIVIGGFAIFNNSMSVGELVSFYTLSSFFISPMNQLVDINSIINDALVASERLMDIMTLKGEQEGDFKGLTITKNSNYEKDIHDIEFKNIEFKYPGRELLFKDFNATIKGGEISAIIGKNGCGKSTISALLMRDRVPNKGEIKLNGTNINLYDITNWREYIGIASQNVHLFNSSILDNIIAGAISTDLKRVAEIVKELEIDKMIEEFPQGLLTFVGSKGKNLSGGQMQKIAIARLLYKEPQIYIFDEATSYMDQHSENLVIEVIKKLKKQGKSIIIISHRKNIIDTADNIIKL